MNIGLTGGIATGKSTVAALLQEQGAILIDADQVAREVVLPGEPALQEIFARFGQALKLPDGSLNRKALGEIVFSDAAARKDLENILHPRIRAIIMGRMAEYERKQPDKLVVADIPLLFESGSQYRFQQTMLVYVPEDVQLARLMARDAIGREAALRRMAAQIPIEEKKRRADIVIDNSGTLAETKRQIDEFLRDKGLK
ncbi:MAG TPA: dephospho-CoA kinase [Bacilli bacterium]